MKFDRFSGYTRSAAYWVLLAACPAYGLFLAGLPDLKVYKVLNIIGATWNILGLVTLSYLNATTEKFQVSAMKISSFLFAILLLQLPAGLMLGGIAATLLHYPSAKAAFTIGGYLFWPGAFSMFLFTGLMNPKLGQPKVTQKQISIMGGYFLLSGLLALLCGAVFDLIDFNG
jgi:hypothetical protein